jgi:GntR family transcriptional regulator
MITIDLDSTVPLFSQLINQIKTAILDDKIDVGSPLPSIRQLATELDINNKTVAKAYDLLERDQVIEKKGYKGTFVRQDAKQHCNFDLSAWLRSKVSETIIQLRDAGATSTEIRSAFNAALNEMN